MLATKSRNIAALATTLAIFVLLPAAARDAASQTQDNDRCSHSRQTPEVAISACTAIIDAAVSGPSLYLALYNRGVAYYNNKDYDRAIEDLTRSIQVSQNPSADYAVRGNVYSAKGDDTRAIADLSMAIKLAPEAGLYYDYRGLHHLKRKDYDRAIADFTMATKLWSRDASFFNHRGLAYQSKGQLDKAIADHSKAIKLDPGGALYFTDRALAYQAKGQIDKAIADHSKAIELDPKSVLSYAGRGGAYWALREVDLGLLDYIRATTLDPSNPDYMWALGYARFAQGDFAQAARDLRRRLEFHDDANVAYVMLLRYLALARDGQTGADAELLINAGRLRDKSWPFPVIEFLAGQRTADDMLLAAQSSDHKCEAHFYIGEWHLAQRMNEPAFKSLQTAAQTCPRHFIEATIAAAELARLKR